MTTPNAAKIQSIPKIDVHTLMAACDEPTRAAQARMIKAAGLAPIPLRANTKEAFLTAWPVLAYAPLPDSELEWLFTKNTEIGIALGNGIFAIDNDFNDDRASQRAEKKQRELLGEPFLRRIGKTGRYADIYFDTAWRPPSRRLIQLAADVRNALLDLQDARNRGCPKSEQKQLKAECDDLYAQFKRLRLEEHPYDVITRKREVEIRGFGAQIAIPPSWHAKAGRKYFWDTDTECGKGIAGEAETLAFMKAVFPDYKDIKKYHSYGGSWPEDYDTVSYAKNYYPWQLEDALTASPSLVDFEETSDGSGNLASLLGKIIYALAVLECAAVRDRDGLDFRKNVFGLAIDFLESRGDRCSLILDHIESNARANWGKLGFDVNRSVEHALSIDMTPDNIEVGRALADLADKLSWFTKDKPSEDKATLDIAAMIADLARAKRAGLSDAEVKKQLRRIAIAGPKDAKGHPIYGLQNLGRDMRNAVNKLAREAIVSRDDKMPWELTLYDPNKINGEVLNRVEKHTEFEFFTQKGTLAKVLKLAANEREAEIERPAGAFLIRDVHPAVLQHVLHGVYAPFRINADARAVSCPLPIETCHNFLKLGEWPGLRELAGLTRTPILTSDGRVITTPGYHADSGLYLTQGGWPDMPEEAAEILMGPFREVAWAGNEEYDAEGWEGSVARAIHMSAMLAAVYRPNMRTCPAFIWDAAAAGEGKTMLAKCVGFMNAGSEPPTTTYVRSEEEMGKRIDAAVLAGDGTILLDNLTVPFGSDQLCNLLTSEWAKTRPLGSSENRVRRFMAMVLATGNNMTLAKDMPRRTLAIRLNSGTETPQAREFSFHPLEEIRQGYRGMVMAAMKMLSEAQKRTRAGEHSALPVGSFESFQLVQEAVKYTTGIDVGDFLAEPAHKSEIELSHERILAEWYAAQDDTDSDMAERGIELHEIAKAQHYSGSGRRAKEGPYHYACGRIHRAFSEEWDRPVTISGLSQWCGKWRGKIGNGLKLTSVAHGNRRASTWRVIEMSADKG